MSLLSDYDARTAWKDEPIRGAFHTHEGLRAKVRGNGSFQAFPGCTVVFRPDRQCLRVIPLMQLALHDRLGGTGMLADFLPSSTIHMTLHDLVSPDTRPDDAPEAYARAVRDSLDRAVRAVEELQEAYAGQRITLAADRIVNMVSKSLVLLLRPQSESDYELLLKMYHRFDGIQPLPYPLTPHITLAYFRPGPLDGDALGAAVDALQIHPEHAPVFAFSPEALTAQRFEDMQTYRDVPERICFCCDGGLNRSVMAAAIVTHLARIRGLPVTGEARAAFHSAEGRPVPEIVWETLERHGITPNRGQAARYLTQEDIPLFSDFAEISGGAMDRIAMLGLPREKVVPVSRFFFGVRDPQYGEVTHEQAFHELYERAERFLDAWAEGNVKSAEEWK